jgi:hypothetical protein
MNDTNWIHIDVARKGRERAIERERERIISLLVEADTTSLSTEELKGWYFALNVIKGKTDE